MSAPLAKASELTTKYADHIRNKVVLVTGASPSTLGGTYVETVAAGKPKLLILAGRSPAKLEETAKVVRANLEAAGLTATAATAAVRTLTVDLGLLSSVRKAAAEVNSWADVPHIDVLVNNAGVMAIDFMITEEGFERTLVTNHLGPFLLTNLLMEKILAAPAPRVVTVSSDGHLASPIRFADINFQKGTYNRWKSYAQSKTANILMAASLAKKLGSKGLLSFSLHPGVIGTNLGNHLDWTVEMNNIRESFQEIGNARGWITDFNFISHDEGTATHVYTSFDQDIAKYNGKYFEYCHLADQWDDRLKPWATDAIEAERLWKVSEEMVGQKFSYE